MNEQLKIIISAEITKLKQNVKEAKSTIANMVKEGTKDMEKFSDNFSKVGDVAKKGLKVVAGAVAGAATALLGMSAATAEYRTAQAKLNTAFEAAGSTTAQAKETYNDLYRVLGDSDVAVEAANHLAKLTTGEKELAEWTDICQGVYATFGDSLPIEGLTEAVNHTAKLGEVQGPLADALEWSGISAEAFNEKLAATNSEAEREKLIRETLTGIYSEAAAGYEKNAAGILAQNEAQAKLTAAMATLGETMAPVMTMLTELGAEILTQLTPYIQEFAEKHLPKVKEALSDVGTKIGEVISWIADNWNIISTIGTIVLAVAAAIAVLSTGLSIYNTVMAITNAVMLPITGTIALVVAAIAALIAIIVLCVKNWDKIKETTIKVWDAMKKKVSEGVEAVVKFFTNMGNSISSKASEIKSGITEKFQSAKDAMSNAVSAAKQTVVSNFNNIKSSVSSAVSNVYSTIKSKMDAAKNSVSSILGNIKSKFTSIFNTVKTTVSNAIERVKSIMNFEWSLPKLKLPHVSISGSFSLMPPSVPHFSIDWYAKGGIFDSPTLFGYGNGLLGGLGENGAEAIVPLEKNTQWLDRIAERLQEGKNIPIVLNVDGKTFAQTSIKTINDLTRQTGTLALNII